MTEQHELQDCIPETDAAVLDEVVAAAQQSTQSPDRIPAPGDHESPPPPPPRNQAPSGSQTTQPGFAHIDGDVNGRGYNETLVDIVCVPCPGADPVETWARRDPLPEDYFGRRRHLPNAPHLWVRQGIRKEVSEARVLLYRHREMVEGVTLDELADDLIEQVWDVRYGNQRSRPLFFIAHSVGGLVVELALLKATQSGSRYKPFMYNCHGVTFFATPHRGSSYLSMRNLQDSIQRLLHLQQPLPHSISDDLRLGHKAMLQIHQHFATIAAELKIWSFYETIDSQLSGGSGSVWPPNRGTTAERDQQVRFGAPIVSIKSSLVGVRQERVFSLDSQHVHCASFGGGANTETMHTYLRELAAAVKKATDLSARYLHTPLSLKEHVKVEIIGFYDDPDAELRSDVRLYITKLHLQEFLDKGPERCLEERLRRTNLRPSSDPAHHQQQQQSLKHEGSLQQSHHHQDNSGLGISEGVHDSGQRVLQLGTSSNTSESRPRTPVDGEDHEHVNSPTPTVQVTRPAIAGSSNSIPVEDSSSSTMRPMDWSLTVPALLPPGFDRPSSRSSSTAESSTRSDPTELMGLSPKAAKTEDRAALDVWVEKSHSEPLKRHHHQDGLILSKASALDVEDLTAGFSRPDPAARKYMWINTPATNASWVRDVFDVLANPHDPSFAKLFNNENWTSKHVIGRHCQSQPSFVKPSCNYIPAGSAPSPHPSPSLSGRTSLRAGPSSSFLYVYLPFLHFDTYINVLQRRKFILRRMQHGRARPVPQDIAQLESAELRVIWEYIGYDPPLNYRRTLDQFAHPSLRDTWARDDDQMLYKLTKDRTSREETLTMRRTSGSGWSRTVDDAKLTPSSTDILEEEETRDNPSDEEGEADLEEIIKDGKLLMVDQLWLWAIDTTTLTTFFSKRESKPKEGPLFQQGDLRNSVYNELNGDLAGRCENALDLAAFIVLHAITVLLDRTSHPDLEIFRIFEEAISMLTERMTSSLKRFRMQTFKDVSINSDSTESNRSRSSSSSHRPESIKKRHKRELEASERENRENTSALMELRDLEDELTSLERLFEAQDAVVKTMRAIYESDNLKPLTRNGRIYLDEALAKLDEYKSQTTDMLKRVDITRNDYEKLLEMVQRQAQVDEVRWSRLQTELASSQNLSVMIFTTFTVIFLPLSFFTSLFGMNTVEWDSEQGHLPSISYIGAISMPVSVFLIVAALVAAFSTRVQEYVRSVYRGGKHVVKFAWWPGVKRVAAVTEEEDEEEHLKKRKKKRQRQTVEAPKTRSRDRGYDFWATVRRERGSEYRIPEVNLNKPNAAVATAAAASTSTG